MLIATFSIPTEALALADAVDEIPTLEVEAERIAAHSTEWVMPCLWVAGADPDAIEAALAADPTIDRIVDREHLADESYFHVEWSDPVIRRINIMIDKQGTILEASIAEGRWTVRFRFASREQLDAFRTHFAENGESFQLLDLYDPDEPRQSFGSLTAKQREALVTALEFGYFEVPREISNRELAERLGTSHQAVSELLRRGTGNLVAATLATPGETVD